MPGEDAGVSIITTQTAPLGEAEFIDTNTLLTHLPISRRTLANWRDAGKIPFIATPGRRILFHVPSVRAALLRAQRHTTEGVTQ
jgi:hypothetical protein